MSRLEQVDGKSWRGLVQAPVAVLMLGKTDCESCARWTAELETFLASDTEFRDVRFGKMLLDRGGLVDFKRANPWLADVDVLPYNLVYVGGERRKAFPGGGVDRLITRLRDVRAAA